MILMGALKPILMHWLKVWRAEVEAIFITCALFSRTVNPAELTDWLATASESGFWPFKRKSALLPTPEVDVLKHHGFV